MQLDKHFNYMPAMSLATYSDSGRSPIVGQSLINRLEELETNEIDALFDMTRPEGDLLGHPEASAILQACEERGIGVTVRVSHGALKACKASLDVLSHRGWLSEIRLVVTLDEIEKSGFFQNLLKLPHEMLRRMALEVDILSTPPTALDPLSKPVLPHERRDTDLVFDVARIQALPRILLCLDGAADPFEPQFEARVGAWRAELTGLLRVARISFNAEAYHALQPHRIASLVRPVARRAPVFFVKDIV